MPVRKSDSSQDPHRYSLNHEIGRDKDQETFNTYDLGQYNLVQSFGEGYEGTLTPEEAAHRGSEFRNEELLHSRDQFTSPEGREAAEIQKPLGRIRIVLAYPNCFDVRDCPRRRSSRLGFSLHSG